MAERHVIFDPLDFLAELAALVPYPRPNLIRYYGVIAPAAKWRASIVPASHEIRDGTPSAAAECPCEISQTAKPRPNYAWALLMAKVFEVDVLACEHCGGRLRIL